jgi:hypothetical protein
MPTITAPDIEVTQVVTGFMYQLSIAEEDGGVGIDRIDIGPYHFDGTPPRVKYPEAVTQEMAPPDWRSIRWITDGKGQSWLRFDGGTIRPDEGEALFQFTSNHAPATKSGPRLVVWRGARSETFDVPVPDYTRKAPARNARHDSTGRGEIYKQTGCLPQLVLGCAAIVGAILARMVR